MELNEFCGESQNFRRTPEKNRQEIQYVLLHRKFSQEGQIEVACVFSAKIFSLIFVNFGPDRGFVLILIKFCTF